MPAEPTAAHHDPPAGLAAVSYRLAPTADTPRLGVWPVALAVGDELTVPLDLATTYEAAVGGHKGRGERASRPAPEATAG